MSTGVDEKPSVIIIDEASFRDIKEVYHECHGILTGFREMRFELEICDLIYEIEDTIQFVKTAEEISSILEAKQYEF